MSNEINGDPPNDEQAPDDHATEPDTDAAAAEEVKPPAADAEPVDTISAADHETAKKDVDWGDPEEDAAARAAADRRQRSQDKADAKEADAAEQDADKADRERQETEAQAEQGRQQAAATVGSSAVEHTVSDDSSTDSTAAQPGKEPEQERPAVAADDKAVDALHDQPAAEAATADPPSETADTDSRDTKDRRDPDNDTEPAADDERNDDEVVEEDGDATAEPATAEDDDEADARDGAEPGDDGGVEQGDNPNRDEYEEIVDPEVPASADKLGELFSSTKPWVDDHGHQIVDEGVTDVSGLHLGLPISEGVPHIEFEIPGDIIRTVAPRAAAILNIGDSFQIHHHTPHYQPRDQDLHPGEYVLKHEELWFTYEKGPGDPLASESLIIEMRPDDLGGPYPEIVSERWTESAVPRSGIPEGVDPLDRIAEALGFENMRLDKQLGANLMTNREWTALKEIVDKLDRIAEMLPEPPDLWESF